MTKYHFNDSISVAYFENNVYTETKNQRYEKKDAEPMFNAIVKKYESSEKQIFVQWRDHNDELIKCWRNFETPPLRRTTKKKK